MAENHRSKGPKFEVIQGSAMSTAHNHTILGNVETIVAKNLGNRIQFGPDPILKQVSRAIPLLFHYSRKISARPVWVRLIGGGA